MWCRLPDSAFEFLLRPPGRTAIAGSPFSKHEIRGVAVLRKKDSYAVCTSGKSGDEVSAGDCGCRRVRWRMYGRGARDTSIPFTGSSESGGACGGIENYVTI